MIIDDIQKAIDTGATIEISYTKYDGTSSIRKLSDIEYSDEYGDTHISAFCHMRKEQRTFKISRISRVVFLSGGDADENSSQEAILIRPINSNEPYVFNPKKKIYPLYGEEYNF